MSTDKRPVLSVTDSDERLRSITQTAGRIQDGLVFLGLEYANKVTGKFISQQSEQYFHLRDSIFYRLESLIFHLNLLLSIQRNHIGQLNKKPYDSEERHKLLYSGSAQQVQLFDSIVFHSISLFDYLGNLVDYIAGGKYQMRLKWTGVIKSVNDKNNPLSKSPIAPVVLDLNRKLVDRLYEHRSDLIHYSTDMGGAQATLNIMKGESDFVVFSPRRITQRFPELKQLAMDNRIALNYVAFWVCESTVNAAHDLLSPLLQHIDIHRSTPKGAEIFFFGNPRDRQANEQKGNTDSSAENSKPTNA